MKVIRLTTWGEHGAETADYADGCIETRDCLVDIFDSLLRKNVAFSVQYLEVPSEECLGVFMAY